MFAAEGRLMEELVGVGELPRRIAFRVSGEHRPPDRGVATERDGE
jgi:hypothetical protein